MPFYFIFLPFHSGLNFQYYIEWGVKSNILDLFTILGENIQFFYKFIFKHLHGMNIRDSELSV